MRSSVTTQSTTAQAEAFLPLTQVKTGIRIRHTHEDVKIAGLRNSAIVKAENYARIAILQKTVRAVVRGFYYRGDNFGVSSGCVDPDNVRNGIKLPLPLVTGITSLKGRNGTEAWTAIANDTFALEDGKRMIWAKELTRYDEYEVIYTAGYAGAADSIDKDALRGAVIEIVQDLYDNPGGATALPASARSALAPYFNSPLTR